MANATVVPSSPASQQKHAPEQPFALVFSGMLLVRELERVFSSAQIPDGINVLFDLEDVTYVESTSLTLLLALLAKFEAEGRVVTLNFPSSKPARDWLRLWKFQPALEMVSRVKSMRRLTTAKTHAYWGENENDTSETFFRVTRGITRYFESDRVILGASKAKFWPFQNFECDKNPFNDALALHESKFWSGPFMMQVMKNVLGANPDYFASDIVFEAMANAVRHPGAQKITTVSSVAHNMNDEPSHFTSSWWDDGRSIVDTLREPLSAGKAVRSVVVNAGIKFALRVVDENDHEISTHSVDESLELSDASTDELLLIGALLPGITRDPHALAAIIPTDREGTSEPRRADTPGMGLHYIMSAAIDIYGGTVSFRTKNLFMHIKSRGKRFPQEYKAKIIRYPNRCSIPGNMVAIRLPAYPE